MTEPWDRGNEARLVELVVADPPEAWAGAGFTVDGDLVHLGGVAIRLTGGPDAAGGTGRGIRRWTLAGLAHAPTVDGELDGLPTTFVDLDPTGGATTEAPGGPGRGPVPAEAHPNGTTGLDHVVVATPDLARTIAALAAVGLDCRRIRDATVGGSPLRQAFFRLGPTVLEVVGGDEGRTGPPGEAPASWYGLAVDVHDLDEMAASLGDGLGRIKGAVQAGRRIATLRHRALGLSVSLAAMDDRGDR